MLGDLFAQQIAVNLRPARHEGGAEAGGERGLRLGHATLGPCHFGGEARQEVIHCLRRAEPCDRREHTKGIAGQHDDVLGVAADGFFARV